MEIQDDYKRKVGILWKDLIVKPKKQINQLVYLSAKALASADKLYGLPPSLKLRRAGTPEEIKIVENEK